MLKKATKVIGKILRGILIATILFNPNYTIKDFIGYVKNGEKSFEPYFGKTLIYNHACFLKSLARPVFFSSNLIRLSFSILLAGA